MRATRDPSARCARSPRRLAIVTALAWLILVPAARAQVPTSDPDVDVGFGENLVGRLGEWYAVAKAWRGALLDRARAMLAETQEAIGIRQRLESRAVGELGVLGGNVPDWRHLAQFCAVDSIGATTCTALRALSEHYESVLPSSVFRAYGRPLFASVPAVGAVVDSLLVGQHPPGVSLRTAYAGTLHEPSVAGQPFAVLLGQRGTAISGTIQTVQAVVDSLVRAEVGHDSISSGRARQLTAVASRANFLLEADLARAAATALQVNTVNAANQVSQYRAARYGGGPLFAW
jgi:hypothetical protein